MLIAPPAVAPPPAPKPKRAAKRPQPQPVLGTPPAVSPFKLRLTVAPGVDIPLLSLATSNVAGTPLGHGHYARAALGAGIGVAVSTVPLSHLAWAVRDVTGSGPRASWALAVALDLSLVLCELVHVPAADAGLGGVCWVMLVVVAAFSMVFNCHAFLSHRA